MELRWLKFTGVYILLVGFLSLVGANLILQRIAEMRAGWRVEDAKAKRRAATQPAPPPLERADTTNKLPPVPANDLIPPSVVEGTTELLKEPRYRK